MQYLIAAIFAAFAMAFSVYLESSSILLAILAYSLTGTVVMLGAMVSAIENDDEPGLLAEG